MKTYPLLQSQLGIFLQCVQTPKSTQYNLPTVTPLDGAVDLDRLASAIRAVVAACPVIRTRFAVDENGDARQWSDETMEVPVLRSRMTDSELAAYVKDGFVRPFDLLSGEPLMRFEIVETESRPTLLVDVHHAIADGLSYSRVFSQALLSAAYDGRPLPAFPYGPYEAAEDETLSFATAAYQADKAHFAERFAGLSFVTISKARPGSMGRMVRAGVTTPRPVCDAWCKEHGVAPNLLFQAAFALVLSRLAREEQVVYHSVNHGRLDRRLRESFGMFVRNMPLRTDATATLKAIDFVRGIKGELFSAVRHGRYPFTHFCTDLGLSSGASFNFLALDDVQESLILDGRAYRSEQVVRTELDDDLSVHIYLTADGDYEIRAESSDAMNSVETCRIVAEAVRNAALNLMAAPEAALGEISVVSSAEEKSLVALGAGKTLAYDESKTFVDLFVEQAAKTPDALAVADATSSLTYRELDERSNALARYLIEEKGVEPDDFVLLTLPRIKEFVVSVLAIHKAGAAYVPVDPEYPADRKAYMAEDAKAKVVIDEAFLVDAESSPRQEADTSSSIQRGEDSASTRINRSKPSGLAYMIYTSGSTGRPKGTMLHHRGLANFIAVVKDMEKLTPADRIAGHRTFSFDAHIEDLYPILTIGGSFHIMPEAIRRDLAAIRTFIDEHGITGGGYSTAVTIMLLQAYPDLPVRFITGGGEKMEGVFSDHVEIINVYGPAECTDDTSYYAIAPGAKVADIPIGRPVANTANYILDPCGRLVPQGMAGELCIAGRQVGRGYWNRPELTAEKFVDCPWMAGEKMYHTGDLARWNADGELEFLGRIDHTQVKLRGFRVELGEVESVASQCPGVKQVLARVTDGRTLALYYTGEADVKTLRAFMAGRLAEYMVPGAFLRLETMPLTPNGKIDVRALPKPVEASEDMVPPATDAEKGVFDLVAEALKTRNFGVTTNLVTCGLTSIAAMRLGARLQKTYGVTVGLTDILSRPTVRELCAFLAATAALKDSFGTARPVQANYPLTPNQVGVYLDWEMNRGGLQYNIPYALRLRGLAAERLADVLKAVVEAHPVLKMRLATVDDEVVQLRRDDEPVHVTVEDLPAAAKADVRAFFQSRVRPFDLFGEDLYRFEIYRDGEDVYFFRDVHHLVTDGLTDGSFVADVVAACGGAELPKEAYTLFDYALEAKDYAGTAEYDADGAYFRKLLEGREATAYPSVSTDAATEPGKARRVTVELDRARVESAAGKLGVTASNYFLTMACEVVRRVTREDDVTLTAVSNGRSHACLERAYGFFVKTLPVAATATPQEMQSQFLASVAHEEYPFTAIAQDTGLKPQILFSYEGELYGSAVKDGLLAEVITLNLDTPKVPITLTVNPDDPKVFRLTAEYDDSRWGEGEMRTFLEMIAALAENYAADTDADLRTLPVLSEPAIADMIRLGTGENLDFDREANLVDLFRAQAEKTPDAPAVVFRGRTLTYREVDEISDRIGRMLLRRGVGIETVVGVMIDRSERMVTYPLAIMKCGGTYMPLDTSYPEERLKGMCEDTGVKLVLSDRLEDGGDWVAKKLPGYDCEVVTNPEELAPEPGDETLVFPWAKKDNRFVILFTSGSTGRPKGAQLEHHGIVNFCHWYVHEFDMVPTDRALAYASFGFDAHMMDIYPALSCGACVHILPTELRLDINALADYMEKADITIAFLTTQLGHLFVSTIENKSLRLLSVSGEKLLPVKKPRYRLYNAGAPTECTIYAFYYPILKDYETSIIGRPMTNVNIYVIDTALNPVPRGVAGEMLIGGLGVGRGYLNRPDLTAERFITWRGEPCYRTGDLVRWDDDGLLWYLGRIDHQVKLRGFRIELGEIESVALLKEGVRQACATVQPGGILTIHYTGDCGEDDLRAHLRIRLTEYMVPAAFVHMDKMPLTPNGKINRKALPKPGVATAEYVEPATDDEKLLAEAYAKTLNLTKPVGANDSFYSLGGDSIKAMKLLTVLRKSGVKAAIAQVIKLQTPRALAPVLERVGGGESYDETYPVPRPPVSDIFASADEERAVTAAFAARGVKLLDAYPLTPMQEGMLLKHLSEPDSLGYRFVARYTLNKLPTEAQFKAAVTALGETHEVLRTAIVHRGVDRAFQAVTDRPLGVRCHGDVGTGPDAEAKIAAIHRDALATGWDFENDPLFRAELIPTGSDSCQVLIAVHHILMDGWSMPLYLLTLFQRLDDALKGLPPALVLAPRGLYGDSVRALLRMDRDAGLAYWQNLLDGYETKAAVPSSGPEKDPAADDQVVVTLGKAETDRLNAVASENYASLANAVELAWGLVLQRTCRQDDVVFAKVVSGRNHTEGAEGVVGAFINSVPVRVKASGAKTLKDLLGRLGAQSAESVRWDFCPMSEIQTRSALGGELFQSVLAFENFPVEKRTLDGSDLVFGIAAQKEETFNELAVAAFVSPAGELNVRVMFDRTKYSRVFAERLASAVRQVLAVTAVSPDTSVSAVSLVGAVEAKELLALGTGEKLEVDLSKTFVDLFRAHVKTQPDALAVVAENGSYTYGELDRATDAFAVELISHGVKAGDFVAVKLGRVREFMLAVIGIWKAGAAYVPIDPEYPEDRVAYMVEDAKAKVVVDEAFLQTFAGRLPAYAPGVPSLFSVNFARPDGVAYMIYTSGSTGKPKGAMLTHANLCSYIAWVAPMVDMKPGDAIGEFVSFSFDGSTGDLYPSLASGATLHIFSLALRRDLVGMRAYINANRVRGMVLITSMAVELLADGDVALDYLLVGGERVVPFRPSKLDFWNVYGPTEFTNQSIVGLVDQTFPEDTIPIGRPVPNTIAAVIDTEGNLVPRGLMGELALAGPQLGLGYHNRPELTAAKFAPMAWIDGAKAYRTGDLVRWREDGRMDFVGRVDNQVKLRGFRIEMGEIETALLAQPGVSAAIAEVKKINGAEHLVAYYVDAGRPESAPYPSGVDEKALRVELAKVLSDYMVPEAFVRLEKMPLTPNGKIDRKALPVPEFADEEALPPETEAEKAVFAVVADALRADGFGVTTNLVSFGLTSITAMRLAARLQREFGVALRMTDLVAQPTVRAIAAKVSGEASAPVSPKFGRTAPAQETYPLTANQVGVYLDWSLHPDGLQYNVPYALRLEKTDADRFAEAVRTVVAVHPVLKTRLADVDGEIRAVRRDGATLAVTVADLPAEAKADVQAFFQSRVRPFDLFHDDLCRFEIYRDGETAYFFRDIHHIVTDGLSDARLLGEIAAVAQGGAAPNEAYTAFDYALESADYARTEAFAADGAYFRNLLDGLETTVYPASRNPSGSGRCRTLEASVPRAAIDAAAAREGVTVNNYLLAVLLEAVRRVTREEKPVVSAVSNGRGAAALESVQGFFVKTVPVVWAASPKAVQDQFFATVSHEEYPLTRIVEDTGVRPEILYTFEGQLLDGLDAKGTGATPILLALDTVKTPLGLLVHPDAADTLAFTLEYDDARYTEDDMRLLMGAICALAANYAAADAGTALTQCALVSPDEEAELLRLSAGPKRGWDLTKTFVDLFTAQAAKTPDALAVADGEGSLTYRELDEQSNRLANHLIAEDEVEPDDFVMTVMPRVKEFVVCVLAIQKAGAAYVPVDPSYPPERRRFMAQDSGAKAILTPLAVRQALASDAPKTPVNRATPAGLAYMIYTSGSTGKPKGAMLRHKGLTNFIHLVREMECLTPADRVSGHRSFSFDAHIEDLYPILTLGGSYHIMPEEIRRDLTAMRAFIDAHKVTGGGYSTAVTTLLMQTYPDLPVRFITGGGEKMEGLSSDHVTIINVYGPTECTDDTSYYVIPPKTLVKDVPIGRPVANTSNYIVDAAGNLLPKGMVGELCIAGCNVGKGYWNRPKLSAAKFVDCPWLAGEKMYHTGDLAYWNDAGELMFVGRVDHQVKLRGFRIELGEIETVALQTKGVKQSLALVAAGETLVLYYTGAIDEEALREAMAKRLADYMVPAVFLHLEKMPLTPNGKIDRKALPKPALSQRAFVEPATEGERTVAQAFAEVLGLKTPVGAEDGFYALGGDSIKAMRLVSRLRTAGFVLSVAEVIKLQTPRGLATGAGRESVAAEEVSYPVPPKPMAERFASDEEYRRVVAGFAERGETLERVYPLTAMQEGMLLQHVSDPTSWGYRLVYRYDLNVMPSEAQLRRALDVVAREHEVLRTSIVHRGVAKPCQAIVNRALELNYVDEITSADELARLHRAELDRGFDLQYDSLMRVACYRTGPDSCQLMTAVHHIITDGWSSAIFYGRFFEALKAEMAGAPLEVTEENDGKYGDYADAVRRLDRIAALAYWRELLAGYETKAEVPMHDPDPENPDPQDRIQVRLDRATTEALRAIASTSGASLANATELAWGLVLQRWCRLEDVVFVKVVSGRNHLEGLDNVVGPFIGSVPVRIRAEKGETLADALRRVAAQSAESSRWDFCGIADIQAQSPLGSGLFQSIVAFENYPAEERTLDDGKVALKVVAAKEEVFNDLLLAAMPMANGELLMDLAFDRHKYHKAEMERFLAACRQVLVTLAESAETPVSRVSLMTQAAADEVIALGAGPVVPTDGPADVVSRFRVHAERTPDAVAVLDATGESTYGEVDALSDAIAQRLVREAGVHPGDFVAIELPRVKEMVPAALGVMKAGAAYVPVDPEYPEDRRRYMVENSRAKAVIDAAFLVDAESSPRQTVDAESSPRQEENPSSSAQRSEDAASTGINLAKPEGLAYMIYTSGSTGRPKGVMIPHRSLAAYATALVNQLGLDASSRLLEYASFSFDASVMDLFPVLTVGGSVCIAPAEVRKDLQQLRDFALERGITVLHFPAQLGQVFAQQYPDMPVKALVLAAEKVTAFPKCAYRVFNNYGPTEATVHTTAHERETGREYARIPIGRPLANVRAYIVDGDLNLLPRGVAGELCLAGDQVGAGYWELSEQTAKVFVRSPLDPSGRLYRTGDLCYWNEAGEIEILGRVDHQVKVRGFRVELGEIESAAVKAPGVRETACRVTSAQTLALYYTGEAEPEAVRAALAGVLSDYMMPDHLIRMEALPRLPNGKVDRLSLPEPETRAREYVAPETLLETFLCDVFAKALRVERIGVTDSLRDYGLSSVAAMRLALTLTAAGVRVTVRELLGAGSVRELLATERAARTEGAFLAKPTGKPLVVVACGIVASDILRENLAPWLKTFDVYVLEPVYNAWNDFETLSHAETLDRFENRLVADLGEKAAVAAFAGFSFGGDLAWHLAQRWNARTGSLPAVFLGDTVIDPAVKAAPSKALLEAERDPVLKSLADLQARYFAALGERTVTPYAGRAVLASADADGVSREENVRLWRGNAASLDVLPLPETHEGLFRNADRFAGYAQAIEKVL